MAARVVTPWEPVSELFGDEFRQGIRYANWRPCGTGDWLLIYTVAGVGRFGSAAGSCDTRAGDAVLYAPGDPHDYSTSPAQDRWQLLWVHFVPKPHWRSWLRWPVTPQGLRLLRMPSGEIRDHFAMAIRRMIRVSRRELAGAQDLAANALEEALLWANVVSSKDKWMAMDARIRKAIDYLISHAREPFALDSLARYCGLSVSRLALLFKKETGSSPQQFLERHRMQQAGQLLRLTSLSITEIAHDSGYGDPFYFSNRFRRFAGRSPSEYRDGRNLQTVPRRGAGLPSGRARP